MMIKGWVGQVFFSQIDAMRRSASSLKRRGGLRLLGLVLLCGLFFASSRVSYANFRASFFVFSARGKAESHLRQKCLREEKKEMIDLRCDRLNFRVVMKGADRKGFFLGASRPAWVAQGWTTDTDNSFFLALEVLMDSQGAVLRSRSVYVDEDGRLIAQPQKYMPASSTPAKTEYVEPLGPEPEELVSDEPMSLNDIEVGPDFRLEVEPR